MTLVQLGQKIPTSVQVEGLPPNKRVTEPELSCPPCTVPIQGYWHFERDAGWLWAKPYCEAAQPLCPRELGCPILVNASTPASTPAQGQPQQCTVRFVRAEYASGKYRTAYLLFVDEGRTTEVNDTPRKLK